VELILRGIKRIEYRLRATKIIGEQFYIYAARKPGELAGFARARRFVSKVSDALNGQCE